MSQINDGDLPPELSDVAAELRGRRYQASALELDRVKMRILKRTGSRVAARGGRMHKRSLVTAAIMVGAIGAGGVSASFAGSGSGGVNAAAITYGTATPLLSVGVCTPVPITTSAPFSCTIVLTGTVDGILGLPLTAIAPTGTIDASTNQGVAASCTLAPDTLLGALAGTSICTLTFPPPKAPCNLLSLSKISYLGDTVYAPTIDLNLPGIGACV